MDGNKHTATLSDDKRTLTIVQTRVTDNPAARNVCNDAQYTRTFSVIDMIANPTTQDGIGY